VICRLAVKPPLMSLWRIQMKTMLELWDDEAGESVPVELPARYEVCPCCEGRGVTCKLGAMTGSEWAEACHDDGEFPEMYRSGAYDEPCRECRGLRVVSVVDVDALKPEMRKRVEENYQLEAELAAERRAELHYGY
jgi:DnaJ-class molecular chaperone